MNLTDRGVRAVTDATQVVQEARKNLEKRDGRMKDFFFTLGNFDGVAVLDAPAFLMGLASIGYVRTTTLKAFTPEHVEKLTHLESAQGFPARQGYDFVHGVRTKKGEVRFRAFPPKGFSKSSLPFYLTILNRSLKRGSSAVRASSNRTISVLDRRAPSCFILSRAICLFF